MGKMGIRALWHLANALNHVVLFKLPFQGITTAINFVSNDSMTIC